MNMVGVRLSVANFKLGIFISLFVPDLLDATAAIEVVNDCVVTAVAVASAAADAAAIGAVAALSAIAGVTDRYC